MRVVVAEEDFLIGRVDAGDVSLLEDRLGCPSERDDRDDFEVAPDERSVTRR